MKRARRGGQTSVDEGRASGASAWPGRTAPGATQCSWQNNSTNIQTSGIPGVTQTSLCGRYSRAVAACGWCNFRSRCTMSQASQRARHAPRKVETGADVGRGVPAVRSGALSSAEGSRRTVLLARPLAEGDVVRPGSRMTAEHRVRGASRDGSRPTSTANTRELLLDDAYPEDVPEGSAVRHTAVAGFQRAGAETPTYRGASEGKAAGTSLPPLSSAGGVVRGATAPSSSGHGSDRERAAHSALRQSRAAARATSAASAARVPTAQLHEALASTREARVRARWEAQQAAWAKQQARVAAVTRRDPSASVVAHAEQFRGRVEEVDLLEKATPKDERHGAEGWQMNLRGGGTRYIQVGSVFSGLYVPIKEDARPIAESVRRPGAAAAAHSAARAAMAAALVEPDEALAAERAATAADAALAGAALTLAHTGTMPARAPPSSSSLSVAPDAGGGRRRPDALATKRAALARNIAKVKPHELAAEAGDALTAVGVPLFEWAARGRGQGLAATAPRSHSASRSASPSPPPRAQSAQGGGGLRADGSEHGGEGVAEEEKEGEEGGDAAPLSGPFLHIAVAADAATLPGEPGAAMGPWGPEAGGALAHVPLGTSTDLAASGALGGGALAAARGWPRVVLECEAGADVTAATPAALQLPAGRVGVLGGTVAPLSATFTPGVGAVGAAWASVAPGRAGLGAETLQATGALPSSHAPGTFAGMGGAATQALAALTLTNVGTTALYFTWRRVDRGTTRGLDAALALPGDVAPDAEEPDVPGSTPESVFACAQLRGSLAPGAQGLATFAFASRTPGVFRETWELTTVPAANAGATLRIALRGVATAPDEDGPGREAVAQRVEEGAARHAVAEILEEVIGRVRTPPPPPTAWDVRAEQHGAFERSNPGLRYTPALWDALAGLWADAAACLREFAVEGGGGGASQGAARRLPLPAAEDEGAGGEGAAGPKLSPLAAFAASPFTPTPPPGLSMAVPEWDGSVASIARAVARLDTETLVAPPLQAPPTPPSPEEALGSAAAASPKSLTRKGSRKSTKSSGRSPRGSRGGKGGAAEEPVAPPPPPPLADQVAVLQAWLRRRLAACVVAGRQRDLRASPLWPVARALVCALAEAVPLVAGGARDAEGEALRPERDVPLELGVHDALIAHVHGPRGLWAKRHAAKRGCSGEDREARRKARRKARRDHKRVGLPVPAGADEDSDSSSSSEWDSDEGPAGLVLDASGTRWAPSGGGVGGGPGGDDDGEEEEEDEELEWEAACDEAWRAAADTHAATAPGTGFHLRPVSPPAAPSGSKGKKGSASPKAASSGGGAEEAGPPMLRAHPLPPSLPGLQPAVAAAAKGCVWADEALGRAAAAVAQAEAAGARLQAAAEATAAGGSGKGSGLKKKKSGAGGKASPRGRPGGDKGDAGAGAHCEGAEAAEAAEAAELAAPVGRRMVAALRPLVGEAAAQLGRAGAHLAAITADAGATPAPSPLPVPRAHGTVQGEVQAAPCRARSQVVSDAIPLLTAHALDVLTQCVRGGAAAGAAAAARLAPPLPDVTQAGDGSAPVAGEPAAAAASATAAAQPPSDPTLRLPEPQPSPAQAGEPALAPPARDALDGYDAVPPPRRPRAALAPRLGRVRSLLDLNTATSLRGKVVVLRADLDVAQEVLEAAVHHALATGLPAAPAAPQDTAADEQHLPSSAASVDSAGSRASRASRASRGSRLSAAAGAAATGQAKVKAFGLPAVVAASSKVATALASLRYLIAARAAAVVLVSSAGVVRLPLPGTASPAQPGAGATPPAVPAHDTAHLCVGTSFAPPGLAPPPRGLNGLPIIWRKPVALPPPTPTAQEVLAVARRLAHPCACRPPTAHVWDTPTCAALLSDPGAFKGQRTAAARAAALAGSFGAWEELPAALAAHLARSLPLLPGVDAGPAASTPPLLSLRPVARALGDLLGREVVFLPAQSEEGQGGAPTAAATLAAAQAAVADGAAEAAQELLRREEEDEQAAGAPGAGQATVSAPGASEAARSVRSTGSGGSLGGGGGAGVTAPLGSAVTAALKTAAGLAKARGEPASPTRVFLLENVLGFAPQEELGQVAVAAVTGQRADLPHASGLRVCDECDVREWDATQVTHWVLGQGGRAAHGGGLRALALAWAEHGVTGADLLRLGSAAGEAAVVTVAGRAQDVARRLEQIAEADTAAAQNTIALRQGREGPADLPALSGAAAVEAKEAEEEGSSGKEADGGSGKEAEGGASDDVSTPASASGSELPPLGGEEALRLLPPGEAAALLASAVQAELHSRWGVSAADAAALTCALARLHLRAEAEAEWRAVEAAVAGEEEAVPTARRRALARVVAFRSALSALGDVVVLDSLTTAHADTATVTAIKPRPDRQTLPALDPAASPSTEVRALAARGDLATAHRTKAVVDRGASRSGQRVQRSGAIVAGLPLSLDLALASILFAPRRGPPVHTPEAAERANSAAEAHATALAAGLPVGMRFARLGGAGPSPAHAAQPPAALLPTATPSAATPYSSALVSGAVAPRLLDTALPLAPLGPWVAQADMGGRLGPLASLRPCERAFAPRPIVAVLGGGAALLTRASQLLAAVQWADKVVLTGLLGAAWVAHIRGVDTGATPTLSPEWHAAGPILRRAAAAARAAGLPILAPTDALVSSSLPPTPLRSRGPDAEDSDDEEEEEDDIDPEEWDSDDEAELADAVAAAAAAGQSLAAARAAATPAPPTSVDTSAAQSGVAVEVEFHGSIAERSLLGAPALPSTTAALLSAAASGEDVDTWTAAQASTGAETSSGDGTGAWGLQAGEVCLELGPRSRESLEEALASAGTAVMVGPCGACEVEDLAGATREALEGLAGVAGRGGLSVVAGASLAAWAKAWDLASGQSWIMPAGAATAQILQGRLPPGVAALDTVPGTLRPPLAALQAARQRQGAEQ